MTKARFLGHYTIAAFALVLSGQSLAADKVTLGHSGTVSEALYFIAAAHGYYKNEGLDVTHTYFDSAAKEIPLLATGELDVGSGPVSAGLFNAAARGIKIKIVGNRLAARPDDRSLLFLVRKDLIDVGRVKSYADLRGLKIALVAKGIGTASVLNEAAKRGGISYADVEKVYLPFPLQAAAFQNRAIDGAFSAEPFVKDLIGAGVAAPLGTWGDIYPDFQVGVMLFSEKFAKERRHVGVRLLRALLRASRDYQDVLDHGRFSSGPKADEIVRIIAEGTSMKEHLVRTISLPAIDLDRPVNLEALQKDLSFFKAEGDIPDATLTADQLVELSMLNRALKSLGPRERTK
jgi:NitT/TauT family transport system substrate-binding protein